MIEFISITKQYQDFKALDNINLQINPSEFVFLTGHSGSGKTTLIKMLIREILPTAGKVIVDNEDITILKQKKVYSLRRKIGVVFQDFKLIDDKTTYENVAFAMEASGRTDKEIKEVVPYVLDIVGLVDKMGAFPQQLSGGQKQKVAIARAIANDPKILIADEPTGNLDEDATWDIVEILKKINQWGTTVIMSTHSAEILRSSDQRMITLERGTLIADTHSAQKASNNDFAEKILEKHESKGTVTKEKSSKKEKIKVEKVKDETPEEIKTEDQKILEEQETTEVEHEDVKEPEIEEKVVAKKPLIKITLAKKKNLNSNTQDNSRQTKSGEFNTTEMSQGTIKILKDNKYNNIQDLITEGIEKIKLIDGINGDNIIEIEKSIEDFIS